MKRSGYAAVCALILLSTVFSAGGQEKQKMSKANLVVNEWNVVPGTNARFLDHQTIWDADGKKSSEIEYGEAGQKWRKVFEYDGNGLISRVLTYNEKNRLDNIRTYEFNEYGKKKRELIYSPKGKLVKIKEYEYLVK